MKLNIHAVSKLGMVSFPLTLVSLELTILISLDFNRTKNSFFGGVSFVFV